MAPKSAHDLLESDLQRLHGSFREASAEASARFGRIAGWLVAGNAGALLLCFNALLDNRICNWTAVLPLANLFAAGLATAFLSVVADWVAVLFRASNLASLAANMGEVQTLWVEREVLRAAAANNQEAASRLVEIGNELARAQGAAPHQRVGAQTVANGVSGAFIGLSIAMLAFGTIDAVSSPSFRAAMCATAPAQHTDRRS